ncbi:MAG TPA: sugar ABC transporter permease [Candidatus Dormibacteraeota bacterium]|nr:sugar ABC transporter permease [Candidatus Dormibacteraeota bacterium]
MSIAALARREPSRRRGRGAAVPFWLFIGPLCVGLLVFTVVPIAWGFLLSFSRARGSIALGTWVGLSNYANLLSDPQFRGALATIVVFAVFIVPVTFCISLGLALLVNQVQVGRGFFRTVFFIPTAVSYVVASLVWKMEIFSVNGLANIVVGLFHGQSIAWVSTPNPPWFWLVLVTVRLWLQVGLYLIIFLAGLQDIPQHLYESAAVDGARRGWRTFWYITLPQLRNTSVAVLFLILIAAFQAFDEFYNILGGGMTSGGNATLARTPLVYLYQIALGQQDYGRGSAGAFILTALIVIVTLVQSRVFGFGRAD